MLLHETTGLMEYGTSTARIWVDEEIAKYYRSLIPKAKCVQAPMYAAHITVVRTKPVEIPTNMAAWGKYTGQKIAFSYDPQVQQDGVYWYLPVYSEQIGDIREELGLPRFRHTDLGKPAFTCYHITVGNTKIHAPQKVS